MKQINITNNKKPIEDLVDLINQKLSAGKSILFLVSGGSNIEIVVNVISKIQVSKHKSLFHLGLIDERYGPEGHSDSNWQQILNAGPLVDDIQVHPMLHVNNSITETVDHYNRLINKLIDSADYTIGLFGVGIDGHTAGLLPNNPIMESDDLYAHYKGVDYERISITPKGIKKLDQIIVYGLGKEKWPAIDSIYTQISIDKIPASIFKHMKNVIIYSDHKGEKI